MSSVLVSAVTGVILVGQSRRANEKQGRAAVAVVKRAYGDVSRYVARLHSHVSGGQDFGASFCTVSCLSGVDDARLWWERLLRLFELRALVTDLGSDASHVGELHRLCRYGLRGACNATVFALLADASIGVGRYLQSGARARPSLRMQRIRDDLLKSFTQDVTLRELADRPFQAIYGVTPITLRLFSVEPQPARFRFDFHAYRAIMHHCDWMTGGKVHDVDTSAHGPPTDCRRHDADYTRTRADIQSRRP